MIIPELKLPSLGAELPSQIRHWGLFGQVALTGIQEQHVEALETTIKQVGGFVDLFLQFDSFDETMALRLLNVGASYLLVQDSEHSPGDDLGQIPGERIFQLIPDADPDAAIPEQCVLASLEPVASRLAELERTRKDCLVCVEQLTPEMITETFTELLVSDRPDGLWSTVIVDPLGIALGLAYSNAESLLYAIEHRVGTYWSRSRSGLWVKGETSGATQQLLNIRMDCDRDCLRFQVTQGPPGFCHRKTHSCFGYERSIPAVIERLASRMVDSDEKSFTRKLANDPAMLEAKLLEEAQELSDASQTDDLHEIAWEAADVLYFSLVAMLKNGVSLDQVHQELGRRMNRVVRRKNKLL